MNSSFNQHNYVSYTAGGGQAYEVMPAAIAAHTVYDAIHTLGQNIC